jgi:hypothetical protein
MGDRQVGTADIKNFRRPPAEVTNVKILIALLLLIAITTSANALCLFGFGNTCPIDAETAAKILMPRVNGTRLGSQLQTPGRSPALA